MPAASKKPRESAGRTSTINLRVPEATRELIDSAAAALGKSRTEFMLESSRQHAIDVLLDQRLFAIGDEEYEALERILQNPPPPSPKLKELLGRKAPWER